MRRRSRILVTSVAVLGSVGVVVGLIRLGSASEGPVSATLRAVGSGVSRLESAAVARFRGTSRADRMAADASPRSPT